MKDILPIITGQSCNLYIDSVFISLPISTKIILKTAWAPFIVIEIRQRRINMDETNPDHLITNAYKQRKTEFSACTRLGAVGFWGGG